MPNPPESPSPSQRPAADEASFLRGYDADRFPRPSVAVDVVALTVAEGALKVGLYRRHEHPGLGSYALPGGFVRMQEGLDEAARRVLAQKLGLEDVFLEQLYTFGAPDRDPRGRVISVAWYALVDSQRFPADRDGVITARLRVGWSGETGGPAEALGPGDAPLPLAFDHAEICGLAIQRLRGKLDYSAVGFQLLPQAFTLRQLQDVHEIVRGEAVNKDSFRRRMLASGQLQPTGEHEQNVTWRPAELYRFARRAAI